MFVTKIFCVCKYIHSLFHAATALLSHEECPKQIIPIKSRVQPACWKE